MPAGTSAQTNINFELDLDLTKLREDLGDNIQGCGSWVLTLMRQPHSEGGARTLLLCTSSVGLEKPSAASIYELRAAVGIMWYAQLKRQPANRIVNHQMLSLSLAYLPTAVSFHQFDSLPRLVLSHPHLTSIKHQASAKKRLIDLSTMNTAINTGAGLAQSHEAAWVDPVYAYANAQCFVSFWWQRILLLSLFAMHMKSKPYALSSSLR